jgi:hypothetical protein
VWESLWALGSGLALVKGLESQSEKERETDSDSESELVRV